MIFKMLSYNVILLIIGVSISLPLISGKAVEGKAPGERTDRIFKGQYDSENEHRYHVAILKVNEDDSTEHICGGAIIDSRYVLTAAHCVYGIKKTELLVRSGWNKNPEQPSLEKRVYHKVTKIMYLKDYYYSGCRHHENDIAILKVLRNFDLADDQNFKKVNLPEYDNDYESYEVALTGYGVEKIAIVVNKTSNTAKKVFKYPEELKYLNTKVLSLEECKRDSPVIVTNGNICTLPQNPNGFSCIGDSGGPLVHDDVVIGIRNSHNSECIHNQPELFTRVSTYLEFIYKVLNQESSSEIAYE